MIRTVAVGTDGSETAGRAMDAAFGNRGMQRRILGSVPSP
jgi:hypothetical protein